MKDYCFNEHIKKRLVNIFGGSERKETVVLDDNHIYLLKLPDPTREKRRIISYINNSISEYIGCKIMGSAGLSVQDVILGEYTVQRENEKKTYIACACKNIIPDGYALAEADKTSLGSEYNPREAEAVSFSTFESIAKCVPGISRDTLIEFYTDLFVMDSLINNPDRHNGNWGFLTSKEEERIAPIYDCGSSLCPLLTDEELTSKIIQNDVSNALSAIQDNNGKRINYKDYLYSCNNEDVNKALMRMIPKIDISKIHSIIDETPYISEKRKVFYKELLFERYSRVLLPALEQVFSKGCFIDETITANELYLFYKNNLEELSRIAIGDIKAVTIDDREVLAKRVTNKYILFINPDSYAAEALFSIRSSNRDVKKTMAELQCIYGKDVTFLLKESECKTHFHEQNKKTTLDLKIAKVEEIRKQSDKVTGKHIGKETER